MLVLSRKQGERITCRSGDSEVWIEHVGFSHPLGLLSLSITGPDYFLTCSLRVDRSIKVPIGRSRRRPDWIEIMFVASKCDGERIGFDAPRHVSVLRDDAGPRKQPVDPSVDDMMSISPADGSSANNSRKAVPA